MPVLPNELFQRYTEKYGLSAYDANILISSKAFANYYNAVVEHTNNYKAAANWMIGDVRSFLNQRGMEIEELALAPQQIANLIAIIDEGKVATSIASQRLFPVMLERPNESPLTLAEELNIIQDSNQDAIAGYIDQIMANHPDEVSRFKSGEQQLIGFFMGQLMKASKGKLDPKTANQLLREKLS